MNQKDYIKGLIKLLDTDNNHINKKLKDIEGYFKTYIKEYFSGLITKYELIKCIEDHQEKIDHYLYERTCNIMKIEKLYRCRTIKSADKVFEKELDSEKVYDRMEGESIV